MDALGQMYFDEPAKIPVEDKRRLLDQERRQLEEREEVRDRELAELQALMEEH